MVYGYQQLNQNINPGMAQNPAGQQQFGANVPVNNNNNPYSQNFTAVDTQQLKQDAVELSNKAKEQVEDSPFTSMVKNMFGIDIHNPKKTLVSLALTIATVVGLAKLGNSKFANNTLPDLGTKISKALRKNTIYTNVTDILNKGKNNFVSFLRKSKTIDDVFDTFSNRIARPVNQLAKGSGTGLKRIFSLTSPDTVKTHLNQIVDPNKAEKLKSLDDLVKKGEAAAKKLAKLQKRGGTISAEKLKSLNEKIMQGKSVEAEFKTLQKEVDGIKLKSLRKITNDVGAREILSIIDDGDSIDVSDKLVKLIGEKFGFVKNGEIVNREGMLEIFDQLKSGKITGLDGKLNIDVSEFTGITMNNNTGLQKITSDWWPVELVDKIGKKIQGDKWQNIGKGNLGDSLKKYVIISGEGADTKIGSLVQQAALFPAEAVGNFTNDKSGLGFFLAGMIMNLYNNVQDAPKGKKSATLADDFMGTIGSLAITTPLACASMYGLATLKNVKGQSFISKYLLKPIGSFFGAGLEKYVKDEVTGKLVKAEYTKNLKNFLPRKFGGLLRLALVLFVFQGIFMKPIRNVIHKIFGKPYDPAEEESLKAQQAQEEALKNLNMTEEQMMQKLQAHPEFVQALQNDPQAMAAIEKNPALLLQMIASLPDTPAGQPVNGQNPVQPQGFNTTVSHSQMLDSYINNLNNKIQTKAPAPQINPQTTVQPANQTPAEPVRTYIPSSEVNLPKEQAPTDAAQEQAITNPNVQAVMAKADKAMDDAMKFLG